MEHLQLNTGASIPLEGFGVFKVTDKEVCKEAVYHAIQTGYRLFDTATAYTNEDALGEAVRKAIDDGLCTREELFITSKLWVSDMNYEDAKKGIERSLEKSGLDYLDLYLLHQAAGDYFGAWRAMEEAYEAGKLKAIGVSNFYPHTLANFCENVKVIPAVNQIEIHPWCPRHMTLTECKRYGVVPEAWAPLGGNRYNAYENPPLLKIAEAHHKTVAQVMLRWNVQRGVVVIPKSTHAERIEENFNIWDFELSEEDMAEIAKLDRGLVISEETLDPDTGMFKHLNPDFTRRINKK